MITTSMQFNQGLLGVCELLVINEKNEQYVIGGTTNAFSFNEGNVGQSTC